MMGEGLVTGTPDGSDSLAVTKTQDKLRGVVVGS